MSIFYTKLLKNNKLIMGSMTMGNILLLDSVGGFVGQYEEQLLGVSTNGAFFVSKDEFESIRIRTCHGDFIKSVDLKSVIVEKVLFSDNNQIVFIQTKDEFFRFSVLGEETYRFKTKPFQKLQSVSSNEDFFLFIDASGQRSY